MKSEKNAGRGALRRGPIVAVTVAMVCISALIIGYVISHDIEENESDEEILIGLLYDDQYLGFNSTNSGSLMLPVGPTSQMGYPSLENLTLPVYRYEKVDVFSQKYISDTVGHFFPDLEIQNMTQENEINDDFDTVYLKLSNSDCWIHLLSSGGVRYHSANALSGKCDNIRSPENATEMAYDYLEAIGGIPSDVERTRAFGIPMFAYVDDGSRLNGSYMVRFYRNVSDYMIYGSSLCNQMTLVFNSETKELYEFEWHWPKLAIAFNIEEPSKVEDILEHCGMNSTENKRTKITNIEIQYYTPPSIVSGAYDTRSEVYFVAPYVKVTVESGAYYFLSVKVP